METNYDIKLVFDETIYADLKVMNFILPTIWINGWLKILITVQIITEEIFFNKEYNSDEGIKYVAGDYVTVIHSTRVHIKYSHNAGIDGIILMPTVFNAGTYEMISDVLYDSMHQSVCYRL